MWSFFKNSQVKSFHSDLFECIPSYRYKLDKINLFSFLNDDKRFIRRVDVSLQIYSTLLRKTLLLHIFIYKSYCQGICYTWKEFFGLFMRFSTRLNYFYEKARDFSLGIFFLWENLVLHWLCLWILQYMTFFLFCSATWK